MLSRRILSITFLAMLSTCASLSASDSDSDQIDVPGLLRKHCTACHGADIQESNLRLDSREFLLRGAQSGPTIDQTQPEKSELLLRVSSHDRASRMPPEGPGLTATEIDAISKWIGSGMNWTQDTVQAQWENHWAFQPLSRPPIPVTRNTNWIRNPIDSFVLAPLESQNYHPAPPANAHTLARRLYLDLIGLPPSQDDLAGLKQWSPANHDEQYDQLVDQLLASPMFGERWARHWLDVVRFAESNGFETNQPRRNAWPYRDYVIRAMNADKPYRDFIREQLAGDQLDEDAAMGFVVGGAWDEVKSPDPVLTANQRADEQHDMVSTTCSSFLGLTVGCARCHSHKFDPISQNDYYAIKAALAGVQHGERPTNSRDQSLRLAQAQLLRSKLAPIEAELATFESRASLGRIKLIDNASPGFIAIRKPSGEAASVAGTGRGEFDQSPSRFGIPNLGKKYLWYQADAHETVAAYHPQVEGRFRVWLSWGAGFTTHSADARYLLDDDGDLNTREDQHEIAIVNQRAYNDGEVPNSGRPLWSGFYNAGVHSMQPGSQLLVRCGDAPAAVTADVVLFEPVVDSNNRNEAIDIPRFRSAVNSQRNTENIAPTTCRYLKFTIEATNSSEPCIDELMCFDTAGKNVALSAKATSSGDYVGNPFHQLRHINDGNLGNEKSWISNEAGKGWIELEFPNEVAIARIQWSRDGSAAPKYQDRTATKYSFAVSSDGQKWTTVATDGDRLPIDYPNAIAPFQTYSDGTSDRTAAVESKLEQRTALLAQIALLETQKLVYAGRLEMPKATYRLHRGDPMQPREVVAPGSIERFGDRWSLSDESDDADRRLRLANWVADKDHPLTARVIVNRLWHYHFGVGIVDTPSDLGINGGRPSHRELLDWLACELIDHDWSLKHIHRLIVRSATYRQSSEFAKLADTQSPPSDRMLARFNSRRIEAESLRDSLLSIVGNLRMEGGGPGFDLFEPNTNYVKVYVSKSTPGPDTYRRMVYQTKPRMQLENTFGAFDCPDAGQVAPKRTRSVTPLQALSLFNSPFMNEQAASFTTRLQRESSTLAGQISLAFELAYSRLPDEDELSMSKTFAEEHGLTAFCRAILNSSEWMVIE